MSWIDDTIFEGRRTLHREFFHVMVKNCYLYDEYLLLALDGAAKATAAAEVADLARRSIRACLQLTDPARSQSELNHIIMALAKELGVDCDAINFRAILSAIDAIPDHRLADRLPSVVARVVDYLIPPVEVASAFSATQEEPDWEWMRQQALAANARGEKYPAIYLGLNGDFGIESINIDQMKEFGLPAIADPEIDVYVHREVFPSCELIYVTTWQGLAEEWRAGRAP